MEKKKANKDWRKIPRGHPWWRRKDITQVQAEYYRSLQTDKPRLMKHGKEVRMASALEKIQKLQEQIEEARSEAIEELKQKREEARKTLADIERQITDLTGFGPQKAATRRQRDPNKNCPICSIPGHDARAHRSQGKHKKPFTAEELRSKGFQTR